MVKAIVMGSKQETLGGLGKRDSASFMLLPRGWRRSPGALQAGALCLGLGTLVVLVGV